MLPTLREACGVFGVYAPGEDVARVTFFGLYALQHRGQESAGIATSNSRTIYSSSCCPIVPRSAVPRRSLRVAHPRNPWVGIFISCSVCRVNDSAS